MHRQIYLKFTFHLSLLGILVSILVGLYDVIFGSIWEFCHLVFEVVEMGLDRVVEHTFETEVHETQLIVFYILLTIGGFLIYFAWKILVEIAKGIGHVFSNEWAELKTAVISDWGAMSMTNKIFLISIFLLVNYLASFLLF